MHELPNNLLIPVLCAYKETTGPISELLLTTEKLEAVCGVQLTKTET